MSAGQGKNCLYSAVYMEVNEHFEPIFNAVMGHLNNFKVAYDVYLEPVHSYR